MLYLAILGVVALVIWYSDRKYAKGHAQGDAHGYQRASVYYEKEFRRLGVGHKPLELVSSTEDNVPRLPELPRGIVIANKSDLKGQR